MHVIATRPSETRLAGRYVSGVQLGLSSPLNSFTFQSHLVLVAESPSTQPTYLPNLDISLDGEVFDGRSSTLSVNLLVTVGLWKPVVFRGVALLCLDLLCPKNFH